MHGLRNEVLGRGANEHNAAADIIISLLHKVAVRANHLSRPEAGENEHAAEDGRTDLVQAVLELRDDAVVTTAAAQTPEEVWVLTFTRVDDVSAGQHNLSAEHVIDGITELAFEPAGAAAEGQATDSGAGHAPPGYREPMLLGRGVELAPRDAAFSRRHPRLRIDCDLLHQREVDHQTAVAHGVPRGSVSSALDGHEKVAFTGEVHGSHHVLSRRAACN